MKEYLEKDIFKEYYESLIYVERIQSDGKCRRGIVGKIDLESYDYHAGTDAEIRATEQTVLSRIPPRVEIRKNAPLELPHVMLLFDDIQDEIFSYLSQNKNRFSVMDRARSDWGGGMRFLDRFPRGACRASFSRAGALPPALYHA